MKIRNSTAIVTGGSGGIGLAVAGALAERGAAKVGVVDLSSACQDAVRQLSETYPQCAVRGFEGDVTEESFRKHVFSDLESDGSPVNICVPAQPVCRESESFFLGWVRQPMKSALPWKEAFVSLTSNPSRKWKC